jgi:WD40 repeat protein
MINIYTAPALAQSMTFDAKGQQSTKILPLSVVKVMMPAAGDLPSDDAIESLQFSPDGKTLVAVSSPGLSIPGPLGVVMDVWDVPSGRMRTVVPEIAHYTDHLGFSSDGNIFFIDAFIRNRFVLRAWDTAAWRELQSPPRPPFSEIRLEIDRPGSVTGPRGDIVAEEEGDLIRVIGLSNFKVVATFRLHGPTPSSHISQKAERSLDIRRSSPDGKFSLRQRYIKLFSDNEELLAVKVPEGKIIVWALHRPEAQTLISCQPKDVPLAFSLDGRVLATASEPEITNSCINVKFWSIKFGFLLNTAAENRLVSTLRFAPDGRTVAIGGFHRTVKLWRFPDLHAGDEDKPGSR